MIIKKDEIRGIWVVFKAEKSAKFEMFNSKLKKDCENFIERMGFMYLAKKDVFSEIPRGSKTKIAEKLQMNRSFLSLVLNSKKTTKYLTAKAICEYFFGDSNIDKYFDRVK